MGFLTETAPERGVATEIIPGIRRLVAANPSVMTYHGTNSYLIETAAGLSVLDPGPDDEAHVQDLMTAAGSGGIARIIITHGHLDHYGAAARLAGLTGAPLAGFAAFSAALPLQIGLADGAELAGLTAIHTPGHAPDHLSFAYRAGGQDILFSGDHVMSWSSSIVSPPEGDMSDYYRSLHLLLRRSDTLYLPGHGPPLFEPRPLVEELLAHRHRREAAILDELRGTPADVGSLATVLYGKIDPWLKIAAERNVLAHLLKLRDDGLVTEIDEPAPAGDEPRDVIARRDAKRRFVPV